MMGHNLSQLTTMDNLGDAYGGEKRVYFNSVMSQSIKTLTSSHINGV